jgi:hypothetical protein
MAEEKILKIESLVAVEASGDLVFFDKNVDMFIFFIKKY